MMRFIWSDSSLSSNERSKWVGALYVISGSLDSYWHNYVYPNMYKKIDTKMDPTPDMAPNVHLH